MMIFDTHAHVFVRGLPLAQHCRYVPNYDATPESYLDNLDRAGINIGILIQPSFLGTDNHYMLQALRHYPDRLRGVAVIDPTISFAELEEMNDCGVVGIRLNLIGMPLPNIKNEQWQKLLKHIQHLGWHVELHRPAVDLPELVNQLIEIKLKIVIDHFGLPNPRLRENDPGFQFLLEHSKSKKIWIKLSAAYRNGDPEVFKQNVTSLLPHLLNRFGPEKLLWGSDWPHTRFEKTTNYMDSFSLFNQWIPDEKIKHQILSLAPKKLIAKN